MDKPYDDHILSWQEMPGFMELYYSMCNDYKPGESAYEAAERNFERYYGKRKFSNYDVFRVNRSRFLKKK